MRGLLRRDDPLPEGVPEQVSFFFGGGQTCAFEGEAHAPKIQLGSGSVIPTAFIICFYGFRHDRQLRITIAPPVGRAIAKTLARGSEEGFVYRWPRLPNDPAGAYRVAAQQGSSTVTEVFTVVRPATPRLWLDKPPGQVVLGEDVHMYVAGFPPSRTVVLNLYYFHHYRTSFPVPVDARGGGRAVLRTAPGDPVACWGVSHPDLGDSTDPGGLGPTSTNVFCTTAPGG
ncbi:hypothetical protein GCM10012284_04410 [Mangrovihabitans endophyticus]|uniref:Uncharacterized protein n=1 Tax=Mangrovihabitans endophyticus TaxID=1751298 RepID=A0A8J3BWT7_9ACTN|nr:hypothetical protein GCM10012284_04410 [Mangrovihabitans endophyticus]